MLQGPRGIGAVMERRRQVAGLEKRNAELARENERKREHIRRLSDSPAEQDREIRERLKLVEPQEKVFITGDPRKP
jgi:cell division protein FtsB